MERKRYLIDEGGYISKGRRRLGHIADLLNLKTQLSKSVRRWWYDDYLPSLSQSAKVNNLARNPSSSTSKAGLSDTHQPFFS